jgi:putative two-component system response regulator
MAAIADVFDALTSDKIYKRAVPFTEAFAILSDNRGTHFDAEMLDIFLTEKSRVLGIKERFADTLPGGDEMSELSALAADV